MRGKEGQTRGIPTPWQLCCASGKVRELRLRKAWKRVSWISWWGWLSIRREMSWIPTLPPKSSWIFHKHVNIKFTNSPVSVLKAVQLCCCDLIAGSSARPQHTRYSSRSTMLTHCIAASGTSLFFSILHCGVCIILYSHALENSPSVYNPWEPFLVLTRSLESLLFSFCSLHFQWVWHRDTFAMHRNIVKTTQFLLRRLHTTAV